MSNAITTIGVKSLSAIFAEEGHRCGRNMAIEELATAHPFFAKYSVEGFTHVHVFREASRPDIEIDYRLFLVDVRCVAANYECECIFSELVTMPTSGQKAVFLRFQQAQSPLTGE